jgi:transposase
MAQKLEHREQRMALEELLDVLAPMSTSRINASQPLVCVKRRSASSVWSRQSATRCPNGRLPRWSRPCSTGDKVNRGGITKAGNGRARRILVEAAWAYRHPARVGRDKQAKVAAAPRPVRGIAWKAQTRLCARFRSLLRKGKKPTVVATAIARELAAFVWAINREVGPSRTA